MSRRTFMQIGDKSLRIPSISSPYNEYRCIGVRLKSLGEIERAINGRLKLVYIDKFMNDKYVLDYEKCEFVKVSE